MPGHRADMKARSLERATDLEPREVAERAVQEDLATGWIELTTYTYLGEGELDCDTALTAGHCGL